MSYMNVKKDKKNTIDNDFVFKKNCNQATPVTIDVFVLRDTINKLVKNLEEKKEKQGFLDNETNKFLLRLKVMLHSGQNNTHQLRNVKLASGYLKLFYN